MHVCMHVPTAAQPHLKGVRVRTTSASVCAATISLIHPLCPSVCLYMYVSVSSSLCIQRSSFATSISCDQTVVMKTYTNTQSHTFNTFTQAQYSVNSHEKHENSPKRWKPGKGAGWQGRKLVAVQRKRPASRRNRELARQLSYIIRKANKQETNICISFSCVLTAVVHAHKSGRTKNRYVHTH